MPNTNVDSYEVSRTHWRATCYDCHAGVYAFENPQAAHQWAADHVCKPKDVHAEAKDGAR